MKDQLVLFRYLFVPTGAITFVPGLEKLSFMKRDTDLFICDIAFSYLMCIYVKDLDQETTHLYF